MNLVYLGPDKTRQYKSEFLKLGQLVDVPDDDVEAFLKTGEFEKEKQEQKKLKKADK